MRAIAFMLAAVAALAAASGAQGASHHRHRSHVAQRHHGRPIVREDTSEGVYTRSDDRVYGGSYYGFFTSPSYGRFQSY